MFARIRGSYVLSSSSFFLRALLGIHLEMRQSFSHVFIKQNAKLRENEWALTRQRFESRNKFHCSTRSKMLFCSATERVRQIIYDFKVVFFLRRDSVSTQILADLFKFLILWRVYVVCVGKYSFKSKPKAPGLAKSNSFSLLRIRSCNWQLGAYTKEK